MRGTVTQTEREVVETPALQSNRRSSYRRAFNGIGWNVIGSIVGQGGSFLSSVLLARLIGKQPFGQFAMIQSTIFTLTSFAALGLGITATKYVSQYRTTDPEKACRILGLSSIIAFLAALTFSAGLITFAPSIASDTNLVTDLRLGAMYVLFITLNGYQVGALAGLEAFKSIATISIITGPATVLLTWVLASRFGIRGAILAQGFSALIIWFLFQLVLTRQGRVTRIIASYRDVWGERFALVHFSVPATVSSIIGSVAIWWCNMTLVKTSGYAELALFTAANTLRLMGIFLPGLITKVTSPMLNNLMANADHFEYQRTFRASIATTGGIALLFAVLLWAASKQMLHLFGRDFAGSSALVVLMLGSMVVEVLACNLYQAVFTADSLWWQVAIITIWGGTLGVTSTLTIPRYGATGLAASYLVAWCVSGILYGAFSYLNRKEEIKDWSIRNGTTPVLQHRDTSL